jgi:hypothetical protein
MTLSKSGYDPEKKKKRRWVILWILAFLGLSAEKDIPPAILAWLTWETVQDMIRKIEVEAIKESGLTDLMDWVTHPEDSETGVCDYCQSLADNGPYVLAIIPDTHPNCKCTLAPHIE